MRRHCLYLCSADDTDLSCVFLPGGPSDLIPSIGCCTTHKTGCHGFPAEQPQVLTFGLQIGVRLRLPVETDCLKLHAYFVFRLFLLYAVLEWGIVMLRGERGPFLPWVFVLWWVCVYGPIPVRNIAFNQRGIICVQFLYSSGKHLPLFLYWPFCTSIIKWNSKNKDCFQTTDYLLMIDYLILNNK